MSRTSSNRKRVIIIRNAFPYDFGGAERFPVHLASEIANYGYEAMVISRQERLLAYADTYHAPTVRCPWLPLQNYSGPRIILAPIYVLWQIILFIWYLQLSLRLRPDIMHPQSKDDFIAATLAGKLFGMRIIWTDHADLKYIFANHRVWYKNPIGKLVYWASKYADVITLVSNGERQRIEQVLGRPLPSKYITIHNGVFDEAVTPVGRKKEDADSFIFCTTSRLVTAKGIGELITAFQAIHAEHPDVRLWLVGDGPEAEKFKAQAEGIAGISFLGHSDNALAYVAAADAFVHPSYHEGFSLSIVEAAMLGKPIVACQVGGNTEIITDNANGLLVPAQDSTALATAMTRLLSDKELARKLGETARHTFLDRYDFRKIVKREFLPRYEQTKN